MSWLSPYLIALIAALILSHVAKHLITSNRNKHLNLTKNFFASGGMPSSHAATSVAVWMVILLKNGVNSGLFGLATVVVLVVVYDAVNVRRSSGEQGEAIKQLINESKSSAKIPRAAKGHTPLEVVVGSIFGACIGLIVFLATV